MSGYLFALGCSALVVGLLYYLLRTRRIQEKYASIWILVAIAVVVLGAFPQTLFWLAARVGVGLPINLLFAVAFVILLTVCIQLSSELSTLQGESRTLAEEVALLRLEVRTQQGSGPPTDKASDILEAKDLPTSSKD